MFPMNLENQQFLESQDNTYNLITLILGVLPKIKIDICLTNDLYKNGHKVFVTNNQKHEIRQVFNQLKWINTYAHRVEYYSPKKCNKSQIHAD